MNAPVSPGAPMTVFRRDLVGRPSARRFDIPAAWVIFVALAYLPNFAPKRSINLVSLTLFWSFFAMTLIILCDQVTLALEQRSLMREVTGTRKAWLRFLSVGALSGVLLDGVAQWLGKLWIYPYWNEIVYAGTFVIGFCAYWLATAETYLAVKAILNRWSRNSPRAMLPRCCAPPLFRALGIAGLALTACGLLLLVADYRQMGGYVFEIQEPLRMKAHFGYFLMSFIGIWFILEWAQFTRGRLSLLNTIFCGDRQPLYALLIASAIFGFFWETVNAAHHFWIYTNWPFSQWQVMGVPVTVLLTWPLQYVVFLSLGFLLERDCWS